MNYEVFIRSAPGPAPSIGANLGEEGRGTIASLFADFVRGNIWHYCTAGSLRSTGVPLEFDRWYRINIEVFPDNTTTLLLDGTPVASRVPACAPMAGGANLIFFQGGGGEDIAETPFYIDEIRYEALPGLRSVSGRVADPAGSPIEGTTVSIHTTPAQTNATDARGKFEFKVAPGVYNVSVVDAGFTVASRVADTRVADATVNFTVARVSGSIFSINGAPLSNATVLFDTRTVFAGPGGGYSALVLPALYNLSGCAEGFECQGKHANATGKNSRVGFFLLPTGKVTHRVAYIHIDFIDFQHPSPSDIEFLEEGADLVSRYFWNQSLRQTGIAYEFPPGWVNIGKKRTDFNLQSPSCPPLLPLILKGDILRLTDDAAKAAGLDP